MMWKKNLQAKMPAKTDIKRDQRQHAPLTRSLVRLPGAAPGPGARVCPAVVALLIKRKWLARDDILFTGLKNR